jgi:hypothetical protein
MTTHLKLPITRRQIFLFFFLFCLLCIGSCQGSCARSRIRAMHTPVHPKNNEVVTFRADTTGATDKIELSYTRSVISVSGGQITVTPVEVNVPIDSCKQPGFALTCTHTMSTPFAPNSLVIFKAVAWDGPYTATEEYMFATGDYPLPDQPIPIRFKGDTHKHLDVVFVPDTDITLDSFRGKLTAVVESFYKYTAIEMWRDDYNFYYSPQAGHYDVKCKFTYPPNIMTLLAGADAVIILHQAQALRDCRHGKVISSAINEDKTIMHESGHALFGLEDEYCCDSMYLPQTCEPNIWASLAACQAAASRVGYPPSVAQCAQIRSGNKTVNFWHIDPAGSNGCLMGDAIDEPGSDFGKACLGRIMKRHRDCVDGNCFPMPDCP